MLIQEGFPGGAQECLPSRFTLLLCFRTLILSKGGKMKYFRKNLSFIEKNRTFAFTTVFC